MQTYWQYKRIFYSIKICFIEYSIAKKSIEKIKTPLKTLLNKAPSAKHLQLYGIGRAASSSSPLYFLLLGILSQVLTSSTFSSWWGGGLYSIFSPMALEYPSIYSVRRICTVPWNFNLINLSKLYLEKCLILINSTSFQKLKYAQKLKLPCHENL